MQLKTNKKFSMKTNSFQLLKATTIFLNQYGNYTIITDYYNGDINSKRVF